MLLASLFWPRFGGGLCVALIKSNKSNEICVVVFLAIAIFLYNCLISVSLGLIVRWLTPHLLGFVPRCIQFPKSRRAKHKPFSICPPQASLSIPSIARERLLAHSCLSQSANASDVPLKSAAVTTHCGNKFVVSFSHSLCAPLRIAR